MSESNTNQDLAQNLPAEQIPKQSLPHHAPGQSQAAQEQTSANEPETNNQNTNVDLVADDDFDPQDYFENPDDPDYFLPEKANCECCQGYVNCCKNSMDPTTLCYDLACCECCQEELAEAQEEGNDDNEQQNIA